MAMTLGCLAHIEIPAPDLAKARDFYTRVFGWEVKPIGPGYALWKCDNMSGGFDADGVPAGEGGARLYIAVADIPAKLKELEAAGGTVVTGKTKISDDYGCFAVFNDPNGNQMCLWSRT